MKKLSVRLLSAGLCAALLCSLAACGDDAAPDNETEPSTTEALTTAPEPEPAPALTLVEGGTTAFTVIRAENADTRTIDLMQQVQKRFESKTGVRIMPGTDWVKRGEEPDAETFEILVGQTNRPETAEALADLRYRDYTVTMIGHKLVICGVTIDGTQKAVNHFLNKVLSRAEEGADFTFTADDNFTGRGMYALDSFTLGGEPINAYSIVCPDGASYAAADFARRMQTMIASQSGYILPIVAEASGAVIAINETEDTAYSATLDSGKLTFTAGNLLAWDTLYDAFEATIKAETANKTLALTSEKTALSGNLATNGDDEPRRALTVDGSLRVMYNNIWGSSGKMPIANRDDMLAELFLTYQPDVIGMQEVSAKARSEKRNIFTMLEGLYTQVPAVATNKNGINATPLVYRADRLTLGDYGFHLYDDGAGDYSKSITWAVFTQKDTGKQFAVFSTHFYWTSDEKGKAARLIDAREITALAEEISTRYGVPVIAGGDLNCNVSSEPQANMTKAGWKNAWTLAASGYRSNTNGHHSYAAYDPQTGLFSDGPLPTNDYARAIDHVYLWGDGVKVNTFNTILHRFALDATDHCPIYVDVDLP